MEIYKLKDNAIQHYFQHTLWNVAILKPYMSTWAWQH